MTRTSLSAEVWILSPRFSGLLSALRAACFHERPSILDHRWGLPQPHCRPRTQLNPEITQAQEMGRRAEGRIDACIRRLPNAMRHYRTMCGVTYSLVRCVWISSSSPVLQATDVSLGPRPRYTRSRSCSSSSFQMQCSDAVQPPHLSNPQPDTPAPTPRTSPGVPSTGKARSKPSTIGVVGIRGTTIGSLPSALRNWAELYVVLPVLPSGAFDNCWLSSILTDVLALSLC